MVVFSRMGLMVVFLSTLVVAGGQEDLYGEYEQRVEVFITRYLVFLTRYIYISLVKGDNCHFKGWWLYKSLNPLQI